MNTYEMKLEARRERLERAAERARERAESAHKRSNDLMSGIPFGQPILVGHHSEARHRRTLERSWNAMGKSVEESQRAQDLEARAAAVGSGGVSSDDPDAVAKLKEQLAERRASQEAMKLANKVVKSKKLSDDEKVAELVKQGFSESSARQLLEPDFCGRVGFADYALSNNNANIRRIEGRIKDLENRVVEDREEVLAGDVRYEENAEDNRVRFYFPGKPSADVRKLLKSHGFRWAPSVGAWQRMLTGSGQFAASLVRDQLAAMEGNS